MPHVLVKMKVQDFDHWKQIFEGNVELRKGYGSRGARVLRGDGSPTDVVVP